MKWIKKRNVESESGNGSYVVSLSDENTWGCSCPVWKFRRQEWGIERRQGFNYIRLAKKEWASHYAKCFGVSFKVYYIAELRDLKDQALEQNDLKLAFDIAKEEAKVMGVYLLGGRDTLFFYPDKAIPQKVLCKVTCHKRLSLIL